MGGDRVYIIQGHGLRTAKPIAFSLTAPPDCTHPVQPHQKCVSNHYQGSPFRVRTKNYKHAHPPRKSRASSAEKQSCSNPGYLEKKHDNSKAGHPSRSSYDEQVLLSALRKHHLIKTSGLPSEVGATVSTVKLRQRELREVMSHITRGPGCWSVECPALGILSRCPDNVMAVLQRPWGWSYSSLFIPDIDLVRQSIWDSIPISQMKKQRLREVKQLPQSHQERVMARLRYPWSKSLALNSLV